MCAFTVFDFAWHRSIAHWHGFTESGHQSITCHHFHQFFSPKNNPITHTHAWRSTNWKCVPLARGTHHIHACSTHIIDIIIYVSISILHLAKIWFESCSLKCILYTIHVHFLHALALFHAHSLSIHSGWRTWHKETYNTITINPPIDHVCFCCNFCSKHVCTSWMCAYECMPTNGTKKKTNNTNLHSDLSAIYSYFLSFL